MLWLSSKNIYSGYVSMQSKFLYAYRSAYERGSTRFSFYLRLYNGYLELRDKL